MLAYCTTKLNVSDHVCAYRMESRDAPNHDILQTRLTYGYSIRLILQEVTGTTRIITALVRPGIIGPPHFTIRLTPGI